MVEKKAKPSRNKDRSKQAGQRLQRTERKFVPERSGSAAWTMVGTVVGGLAIGAGVYGRWMAREPMNYAWIGILVGALLLAAVVVWGDLVGQILRVGDAGVGIELPGKPWRRIAWCDMKQVELREGALRVQGDGEELVVPIKANPKAVAWVLREAEARVPKVVKEGADKAALPSTSDSDGELVPVERAQLTGRACKASGKVITFERDVWLCPQCGALYHKDSVPDRCLVCEAKIEAPAA